MPRRFEGWFRTLRLRLLGPGEIVGLQPGHGLEPDGDRVTSLSACQHRYWGPCTWRTYAGTWGWWTQCRVCGAYARC